MLLHCYILLDFYVKKIVVSNCKDRKVSQTQFVNILFYLQVVV